MKFELVVQTDKLTKFYGSQRGIVDLDLKVRRGEIFGCLGLPGAGKSTTVRLLLDLIRPTRGQAQIWGMDVQSHALELHRRIGYLPGQPCYDPRMTGEQWLRYLARLRGGIVWRNVQQLAARLDCNLKELPPRNASEPPQKLALIQALMHNPELLILDEPSRGLTPPVQHELYRLLAEIRAEGRTVLLTSRNLAEIERACDRVGILQQGRLTAVDEILSFRNRILHRVEYHFAAPVPQELFARLPGVREAVLKGTVLYCSVQGPLDTLARTAAQFRILNVVNHDPDLEECLQTAYPPDAPRDTFFPGKK